MDEPVVQERSRVTEFQQKACPLCGSPLCGTAARRANFYGQLVHTPGGGVNGYGYFLLPKPAEAGQTLTTAPKLLGNLLLSAP